MSTKRQAIWLLSILGLMVVLSAYYLLTEQQRTVQLSSDDSKRYAHIQNEIDSSMQAKLAEDIKVDIQSTTPPLSNATPHLPAKETSITSTATQDYFISLQMKRHEALRKKTEQLMSTIADHQQKPETIEIATQELETISDMQEKIEHLEEELMKQFPQVVILHEGDYWRVSIETNKLEKSQSVSIIDQVVNELQIAPEQIKLHMIKP